MEKKKKKSPFPKAATLDTSVVRMSVTFPAKMAADIRAVAVADSNVAAGRIVSEAEIIRKAVFFYLRDGRVASSETGT